MGRMRALCAAGAISLVAFASAAGRVDAAPNGCSTGSPAYGVGISITPEFVGTDDLAIAAYEGEVIDYDVTVFLRAEAGGVIVCPIFDGTVTVVLPDGSGPLTVVTGLSLDIGQSITFSNVPATKYTVDEDDVVPSPTLRVEATAAVTAMSDGPDDGPQDDAPVTATAVAPTFLLKPSTQVSVTPDRTTVHAGEPVVWTIVERNDTPAGYFPISLETVQVQVSTDGGVTPFTTLTAATTGFTGDNGDGRLGMGEAWSWTVTTNPTADTVVTVTGLGTGPRGRVFTFPGDPDERAAAAVDVISPSTVVGVSASPSSVLPGGAVTLTVTERNDGDVPLTSPSVRLDADGGDNGDIAVLSGPPAGGDTNGNGTLDPGETWTWTHTTNPTSSLTVTATGHGFDPLGLDITFPGDPDERAATAVQVDTPTTTTVAPTTTTIVAVSGTLPRTGSGASTHGVTAVSLCLLAGGGALVAIARRSGRRSAGV